MLEGLKIMHAEGFAHYNIKLKIQCFYEVLDLHWPYFLGGAELKGEL